MSEFIVAIGLKIPDNTAQTALVALRRLGVAVEWIERCDLWRVEAGDAAALHARVASDETLFNPNKHWLRILDAAEPGPGETWIAPLPAPGCAEGRARRLVAWRLFASDARPAPRATVAAAVERLLCNPAIECAQYQGKGAPPDAPK